MCKLIASDYIVVLVNSIYNISTNLKAHIKTRTGAIVNNTRK